MHILVTDGLDSSAVSTLRARGHKVLEQYYEPEELMEAVKIFNVMVVRSKTKVDARIIDAAKAGGNMKMIIRGGVGLDNIDVDYAKENGIEVCNTPLSSRDSVAELALAHIFSCARFISIAGHTMREGLWEKKKYTGIEIKGKTLGIIGYGGIGRTLGNLAQSIGMKVLAFDIAYPPKIESDSLRFTDMEYLLANSDIISLHTPAINGKPLINKETISKMKDGAIIINTSRGSNIDEAALIEALDSGKISAAGLDVFEQEPSQNPSLYKHPKVSCTPHIGASTKEAQKRIGEEIVNIIEGLQLRENAK